MKTVSETYDVAIIGGGAAGLMAAVQLARLREDLSIAVLDGAKRLGAKILISGGGRCNVTNQAVTAKDFNGGSRNVVKRVLKAFSANKTVEFFESLGVPLHEEQHGKLFPDSNKARSVLDALINEADSRGVKILTENRVDRIGKDSGSFCVETHLRQLQARSVVLSTGGKSVPKTGSDGFGFELAKSLGHTILPTFPALAPMLLDGHFHEGLSGIAQEVEITLEVQGEKPKRFTGSMLWTHFGISGPVVLDFSRHWHAAHDTGAAQSVICNFLPDLQPQQIHEEILKAAEQNSKGSLRKFLSQRLPGRFVDSLLAELQVPKEMTFSQFRKEQRKDLVKTLTERKLSVTDSRGFRYAEATAGGVPLAEVNPSTMESRCCDNLFLSGEILDIDGRLGGFNFQWAWSSASVAAVGIANHPIHMSRI
ncbi:BaiN/RdsA family NAD(P)/FAD-dependent oxidoreductase [Thalassoglobus polymorphus]|uniref:Tricarballylate dehydrogenase n=1 Tax=Thalassoglobus polymorphus TaxID=2527994 RepID=A0A517QJ44_9PLAN|nr:NAD(P)/FAD-dependent oxidoreductase [Thalassoglobus polymorphus]QDT31673.1 tricarballylate dehydrogenase [Thalassoglobus polymorphus]